MKAIADSLVIAFQAAGQAKAFSFQSQAIRNWMKNGALRRLMHVGGNTGNSIAEEKLVLLFAASMRIK